MWRSTTVIVWSLGRSVPVDWVAKEIRRVGRLEYNVECFPLMDGFIAIRFANKEDRKAALLNGPWMVAGQLLGMDRWQPNFVPGAGDVGRVVVWLRLPELPLDYRKKATILRIAATTGKPLAVDGITEQGRRYSYTRVKVEVNCSAPFKLGTFVMGRTKGIEERFWQGFVYENLPAPCSNCGRIDYMGRECGPPTPVMVEAEEAKQCRKEKNASWGVLFSGPNADRGGGSSAEGTASFRTLDGHESDLVPAGSQAVHQEEGDDRIRGEAELGVVTFESQS
ncbi:uncharacterized protein LOC103701720 [Phoenix dactylifera]|uniref:Uncharacterized protein LOC103701720 n=1 Tax=Phoenix dactylifera TaxID=42345 RepID=A0A8B7BNE0_PHODC|nr:uncharacterized protein LOC103701720 [Phoenix dactylifera]